jgi:hypothetical protein
MAYESDQSKPYHCFFSAILSEFPHFSFRSFLLIYKANQN